VSAGRFVFVLEPYLPAAHTDCRPREVAIRDILDAYVYLLRAGCSWRMTVRMVTTAEPGSVIYEDEWQVAAKPRRRAAAARTRVRG
jgi:transposase